MQMDLKSLREAVAGGAVAVRSITRLEPAGGPGDKVFPPTYVKEGRAETKYAMETRRVDGREVRVVLLDSVASQANRMEEALLEGWRREELHFPLVLVDFSGEEGLEDIGEITALQAPHRIADAILRDSLLEDKPFRQTPIGQAFTDARATNATGMYAWCPTALLFGVWDSTGPKGGLGAKFQRCIVSEIVRMDAIPGLKTASRIDPLGIERKAARVYRHADPSQQWTVDPAQALKEKGKPVEYGGKGAEGKGSPAAINHGNIPPSIDTDAGGVTMSHAVQTTVLSLAGLRRLHFPLNASGEPIQPDRRDAANVAARTALAALGLAAMIYQRDNGFDLRSRSLLVPLEPPRFELLGRDGGTAHTLELDRAGVAGLLSAASKAASEFDLGWERETVKLRPAPKLADLVRKTRATQIADEGDEG